MRQSNRVSGLGYLSIMLAMLGMIVSVSQTDGWKLRTTGAFAASSTVGSATKGDTLQPSS